MEAAEGHKFRCILSLNLKIQLIFLFPLFCSSTFCPNFRPNFPLIVPEFLASNFFFIILFRGGGGGGHSADWAFIYEDNERNC